MAIIKHLIIATLLAAYTYVLIYFTTRRKAKDDRDHQVKNK